MIPIAVDLQIKDELRQDFSYNKNEISNRRSSEDGSRMYL